MGYRPGGTAIQATVASGCYANIGTNIINYKYNNAPIRFYRVRAVRPLTP